jgi:hypothetical protein
MARLFWLSALTLAGVAVVGQPVTAGNTGINRQLAARRQGQLQAQVQVPPHVQLPTKPELPPQAQQPPKPPLPPQAQRPDHAGNPTLPPQAGQGKLLHQVQGTLSSFQAGVNQVKITPRRGAAVTFVVNSSTKIIITGSGKPTSLEAASLGDQVGHPAAAVFVPGATPLTAQVLVVQSQLPAGLQ